MIIESSMLWNCNDCDGVDTVIVLGEFGHEYRCKKCGSASLSKPKSKSKIKQIRCLISDLLDWVSSIIRGN